MNANRTKALEDAESAFYKTIHGSVQEKEALAKWRNLCETEEEEQIAISAYLRRETNRERRAKENPTLQKQIPKVVRRERQPETRKATEPEKQHGRALERGTPPKSKKRGSKKPPWWHNY